MCRPLNTMSRRHILHRIRRKRLPIKGYAHDLWGHPVERCHELLEDLNVRQNQVRVVLELQRSRKRFLMPMWCSQYSGLRLSSLADSGAPTYSSSCGSCRCILYAGLKSGPEMLFHTLTHYASVSRTKIRTSAVFWAEYDVNSVIFTYYQRGYWFYSSIYHDVYMNYKCPYLIVQKLPVSSAK